MRRLSSSKGIVELISIGSFLLKRRERTLAARSEVLEMLEVKDGRWFGRLDDDSPNVKWMRRVYLRVDYTQASWIVAGIVDSRRHRGPLLCLGSRAKASTLQGIIDVSPAVPHSKCIFVGSSPCWRRSRRSGIIICNKLCLIPHNYRQYWCTQQTACSTHTHPYCNCIAYVRSTTVQQSVLV